MDYSQKAAFRGPPGAPTIKEIYEYGRDKLRLNYIFWGVQKDYFEKAAGDDGGAGGFRRMRRVG